MIDSSPAYKEAIVGDARRIVPRIIVDISDPELRFLPPVCSRSFAISRAEEIQDRVFALDAPFADLEGSRWILNGEIDLAPDTIVNEKRQIGYASHDISDEDGYFKTPVVVEQRFTGCYILQTCSVTFPDWLFDGVADSGRMEVISQGVVRHTAEFTENTAQTVSFSGFKVYHPDALRLTVTRWTLPFHRVRVVEMTPGIYERWTDNDIVSVDVKNQGDISSMTLPYGTCDLELDNESRRFDPRNPDGIFQSIAEKQTLDVQLGVQLPDGSIEYHRAGLFYQYGSGWKTSDNGLTIKWTLVDLIGLLSDRLFIAPPVLPDTLYGWANAIVSQLGEFFEGRVIVADDIKYLPVTANHGDDVNLMSCGDLIRYLGMATQTWARIDNDTGRLVFSRFWDAGSRITVDNMTKYPTMSANPYIASLSMILFDGNNTKVTYAGNNLVFGDTVTIQNPFIHTREQGIPAAKYMMSLYGGNTVEVTSRGDMTTEIGDTDTIYLDDSNAMTARRVKQTFSYTNGVLRDCVSNFLQAEGYLSFTERVVMTDSGTFTVPQGVTQLRLILVSQGGDGHRGADAVGVGTRDYHLWGAGGQDGVDGAGGRIWTDTIHVNPGNTFPVTVGVHAVFGQFSSINGQIYPDGLTDIDSGEIYGRGGVKEPVAHHGDGGKGGKGGLQGKWHRDREYFYDDEGNQIGGRPITVIDDEPGYGQPGTKGSSGCVVLYFDTPHAG